MRAIVTGFEMEDAVEFIGIKGSSDGVAAREIGRDWDCACLVRDRLRNPLTQP